MGARGGVMDMQGGARLVRRARSYEASGATTHTFASPGASERARGKPEDPLLLTVGLHGRARRSAARCWRCWCSRSRLVSQVEVESRGSPFVVAGGIRGGDGDGGDGGDTAPAVAGAVGAARARPRDRGIVCEAGELAHRCCCCRRCRRAATRLRPRDGRCSARSCSWLISAENSVLSPLAGSCSCCSTSCCRCCSTSRCCRCGCCHARPQPPPNRPAPCRRRRVSRRRRAAAPRVRQERERRTARLET